MRIIIEVEAKELAALVGPLQGRRGLGIDVSELSKSVIKEINHQVLETGKPVLFL